jgi:CheY-like chemotaxis protein
MSPNKSLDSTRGKQKTILLIDDDTMLREMYEASFGEEDFSLLTAQDGKEAIDLLEKTNKQPQLILLDILMPGMSGYDVLKIIKKNKRTRNIPVFLLTNLSVPEDEFNHGVKKGAEGYIVKSEYTPQEILKQIKSYLK